MQGKNVIFAPLPVSCQVLECSLFVIFATIKLRVQPDTLWQQQVSVRMLDENIFFFYTCQFFSDSVIINVSETAVQSTWDLHITWVLTKLQPNTCSLDNVLICFFRQKCRPKAAPQKHLFIIYWLIDLFVTCLSHVRNLTLCAGDTVAQPSFNCPRQQLCFWLTSGQTHCYHLTCLSPV